jgi:hypothetical protein
LVLLIAAVAFWTIDVFAFPAAIRAG